ncbi:hypothetical protein PIB30_085269 [Stylosanthes scabra]|uniref:Uncharacterized protein n=1 Tax=Stylosanthes scabra TaxID=79078 RepID=A0ABU6ZRC9_9FABA|nr:hypothetical protein [Stylosanthes scabra]
MYRSVWLYFMYEPYFLIISQVAFKRFRKSLVYKSESSVCSATVSAERVRGAVSHTGVLQWIPLPSKMRFYGLGSHQMQNREVVHETHKADNILLAGGGNNTHCSCDLHDDNNILTRHCGSSDRDNSVSSPTTSPAIASTPTVALAAQLGAYNNGDPSPTRFAFCPSRSLSTCVLLSLIIDLPLFLCFLTRWQCNDPSGARSLVKAAVPNLKVSQNATKFENIEYWTRIVLPMKQK